MAILKSGYVYVWDKKRKKHNYEHRIIMEKSLKRELKPFENVHHINGIKADNRLSNLVIIICSQHAKETWKKRKESWVWSRSYNACVDCNTIKKPHHSKGRCKNCDMKLRRKQARHSANPCLSYA